MRINARKTIIVKCATCGKDVKKFKKEYDRQTLKRGQINFYCNNECSYQSNPIIIAETQYAREHPLEMYNRLVSSPNFKLRQKDELSPFRIYICKLKQRLDSLGNKKECNIDAVYLKKMWEKQNGICPYTELKMRLRDYNGPSSPHTASLDRIDSNLGYIEGNVEFVCMAVNFAKNDFSKEETMNFFNSVRNPATS